MASLPIMPYTDPAQRPMQTLNSQTKVTIGFLGSFLAVALGGAAYLASLKTSVDGMVATLLEVREAIDRNTQQIVKDGRQLSEMRAEVRAIQSRLDNR